MDPLPEEIQRFLAENIDSVVQLEILRVLGEGREREWSAAALATEVQATPQAMATSLATLHGRGLLAAGTLAKEALWRYGPRTPELEVLVGRLLDLYRQRPVTMINLVYAKANEALKAFSDAFRIRKEG